MVREPEGPARQARERAGSPSLVSNGQSRTFSSWNRQQKRVYNRLTSFMLEAESRGAQLFRVDLTTAPGGDAGKLAVHSRELRRRVKREYGYDVEQFQVETNEGHGVYHCVWAIVSDRAVYIHQAWLSSMWQEIHGAHRVWIKRVSTKYHQKNAARYLAAQYLAGQDGTALVRMSYSWKKCKLSLGRGWSSFRRLVADRCPVLWYERMYGRDVPVRDLLPMGDIVAAWRDLIQFGWCTCGGLVYLVRDREIVQRWVAESF